VGDGNYSMTINDNVVISVVRDLASQIATFWVHYIRPMPFERKFYMDGIEVEVKIREVEQDTQPIKRVE
jgi:hypothetical protein